jgi:hypothetical protein
LLDRIQARRARADEGIDGFLERRIVTGGVRSLADSIVVTIGGVF